MLERVPLRLVFPLIFIGTSAVHNAIRPLVALAFLPLGGTWRADAWLQLAITFAAVAAVVGILRRRRWAIGAAALWWLGIVVDMAYAGRKGLEQLREAGEPGLLWPLVAFQTAIVVLFGFALVRLWQERRTLV